MRGLAWILWLTLLAPCVSCGKSPPEQPPQTVTSSTPPSPSPPPPQTNPAPQTSATAPAPGNPASNSTPEKNEKPAEEEKPSVRTLADGAKAWHEEKSESALGVRRVKDDDQVMQGFSWMCQLLPYLEHQALYDRMDFTKSWAENPNISVAATVIPQFQNPHDKRELWKDFPYNGIALTHYVGVSGIEDSRNVLAAELPRSDPRAGVFGYKEIARPADITDGQSNTIMVIGSGELASPWMQGGGATIRGAREPYFDSLSGFGSRGMKGTLALMADGSARVIPEDVDPQVFRSLCTIGGAETVDVEQAGEPLAEFPFRKEVKNRPKNVIIVQRERNPSAGDPADPATAPTFDPATPPPPGGVP